MMRPRTWALGPGSCCGLVGALCLALVLPAWAAAPLATPTMLPGAQSLRLADALELALGQHPDLRRSALRLARAQAEVQAAEARFGSSLDVQLNALRSSRLLDNSFVSGRSEETVYSQSVGLSRHFRLGTDLRLAWEGSYSRSESPGFGGSVSFRLEGEGCPEQPEACRIVMQQERGESTVVEVGPNYSGRLALSLSQALWRGAGSAAATLELRAAEASLRSSQREQLERLQELLATVEQAYWALAGAQAERALRAAALRQAEQELARVEALAERGLSGGDRLSLSSARFARAQQEVELEASSLRMASAGRTLLGALAAEGRLPPTLLAVDPPSAPPDPGPLDACVVLALAESPSLATLRARLEVARLQQSLAEEATRPDLRLSLTLASNGLAEAPGEAVGQVGRLDSPEAQAGISFTLPLGADSATAVLAQANVGVQEIELELSELERGLRRQVLEAGAALQAGFRRLDLARAARALALERAEAAQARLDAGLGDNIVLLQARDDLVRAELSEVATVIELLQARVALDRLGAGLLRRHAPLLEAAGRGGAAPGEAGGRTP